MDQATYICTNPDAQNFEGAAATGGGSCDPYLQDGGQLASLFNPDTTMPVTSEVAAVCNGQNSCSWSIPSASSVTGICNNSGCAGQIQMIGTYDCVLGKT